MLYFPSKWAYFLHAHPHPPLVTCPLVSQPKEFLSARAALCVRAHTAPENAVLQRRDVPQRAAPSPPFSRCHRCLFAMLGRGIDIRVWCLCRRQQLAGRALEQWQMDQTAIREGFLLITNLTEKHANCSCLTTCSSTGESELRKDLNSEFFFLWTK